MSGTECLTYLGNGPRGAGGQAFYVSFAGPDCDAAAVSQANLYRRSITKIISKKASTTMAKFYIQSGAYRLVVQANTARGAALWAVHRTLSQVLSFTDDQPADADVAAPTGRLGETVTVHEQGFDRADGQQYETFGLIHQWNQLMTALDRVQQELDPAGSDKAA